MALELAGGAFLDAIFNVLLERIASSEVISFFRNNKGSDMLLKKLKITLLSVNALLNDAEEKQMRNAVVKEWLDELKDVAFDADDLLDKIYTDAKTGANEVQTLNFTPNPINLYDKELEEILERLEFIIKQKDVLDLKVVKEVKIPRKTPTSSMIEASDVYGRDDDKAELIKSLLSYDASGDKICVIPIGGMGGIGKTTLAQLIYNDDGVKKEFDLQAWIYVSEEFDICKITKTLLEVLTSRSCNIDDLNYLQLEVKMRLMNKKFLLVLDDVWNENYVNWDILRSPFQHGAEGSKIIITTRSKRVASIMQTIAPYNLGSLSDEDCWLLFKRNAFGSNVPVHSTGGSVLAKIGGKIVKKCNGLPLAVKTLAGFLRSENDIKQWYKVLDSEIWDFQDHESNILPALRLSYHYLPSHLKRCFAYCAIFPKDYEFQKEKLILLWMAEDLLQESKGSKRIEDIGDDYFCELVPRSFFQQSKRDKSCFLMHHLVNDLAQFVSKTFSVRLEDGNSNEQVAARTRHLSHVILNRSSFTNLEVVGKADHLRTFLQLRFIDRSMYSSCMIPYDLLLRLRYLRALCLVGVKGYAKELPYSIGKLRHLRYLDLSESEINMLPESISKLYNLQTLKLVGCCDLTELPTEMHNLVNLRYLDISGTCLHWIPSHMSKLTNLQILSDFFIGQDYGSSIGEVGELSNLHGSFFIHHLKFVVHPKDSGKANLKEKSCLEKLSLDWCGSGETDDSQHEKNVLDSLRSHANLKELAIQNYPGTSFPNWLGDTSLCNLVSLQLKGCKYCYHLPPLGHLPTLKELKVTKFDNLVNVGSEFSGYENHFSGAMKIFPALEILRFENMSLWEDWNLDCDGSFTAFPCLRELCVEYCPKLTGNFPSNLPSLTLLVLRDCRQLLSSLPTAPAMRVLNLENCGNLEFPVHLPQYHQSLTSLYLYSSCDSLKFLPLDIFPNLKSLDIWGCKNLEELTTSKPEPYFASLRSLSMSNCPNCVCFPKGGLAAPNLTFLNINYCEKLKSLPEQMHKLMPSLKELQLCGCPEIEPFPTGSWPSNLTSVSIKNCDKLMARVMRWNLTNPSSPRSSRLYEDGGSSYS